MQDKLILSVVGIAALIWLETVALFLGIDGSYFMPIVAAVSGIAGYSIKSYQASKSKK